MSKEQKCKCCQNYWYTSNLTNGLCPNCYDYVSATESQNKRVLEKLELLVRSNQELEKENKKLNAMIDTLPAHDKELEEIHHKDKISFAVEQLERAKENLIEDLYDLYRSPCLIYQTYGDEYDSAIQDAINNTIDYQINQLTNQHEDKGE